MKYLFLLCAAGLVSACSSSPSTPRAEAPAAKTPAPSREQIEHALVSKALLRQMNNPASYQPVSFVLDGVWTKADSVSLIGLTSATDNPKPYRKPDAGKVSGHRYQHAFRATNEMGALVLMGKTVVVYPNDSVVVMNF